MISVDTLFPYVLPFVTGCSEPLARQAIVQTAIEFCDKTAVMAETLDAFPTSKGIAEYDVDVPNTQMRVSRIISAKVDNVIVAGVHTTDAAKLTKTDGKPMGFYTTRTGSVLQVNLYPVPDDKYTIQLTVAYAPTFGATSIEDDLVNYWGEAISCGAVARIAETPNMPFSNPDLAMYKRNEFMRHCQAAKIDSYQGRVRSSTRVALRPLV